MQGDPSAQLSPHGGCVFTLVTPLFLVDQGHQGPAAPSLSQHPLFPLLDWQFLSQPPPQRHFQASHREKGMFVVCNVSKAVTWFSSWSP